jgi:hypothetical protein
MKRLLALAIISVLGLASLPAMAKETNPAVLADYHKHKQKNNKKTTKHQKKKANKVERVPMAKLRNCEMKRKWVPPQRIKEVKICEVTP